MSVFDIILSKENSIDLSAILPTVPLANTMPEAPSGGASSFFSICFKSIQTYLCSIRAALEVSKKPVHSEPVLA